MSGVGYYSDEEHDDIEDKAEYGQKQRSQIHQHIKASEFVFFEHSVDQLFAVLFEHLKVAPDPSAALYERSLEIARLFVIDHRGAAVGYPLAARYHVGGKLQILGKAEPFPALVPAQQFGGEQIAGAGNKAA